MVTEVFPDGSRIRYNYTNHDTPGCMDEAPINVWYDQDNQFLVKDINSKALSRGLLKERRDIDKNGRCVRKVENTYYQDTTQFARQISYREMIHFPIFRFSYCKLFTYYPGLMSQSVTSFSDAPVTGVNNFCEVVMRQ